MIIENKNKLETFDVIKNIEAKGKTNIKNIILHLKIDEKTLFLFRSF